MIYSGMVIVHILAAFALVGPLMLAPKWLYLARHEISRAALHDLHRLTGIAGWLVLISGGVMLLLQQGGMRYAFWMQSAIALFLAIQLFDHFWADRREEALAHDPSAPTTALICWLWIKLALYFFITVLMILKPAGSIFG
jgi:hypothetical protein